MRKWIFDDPPNVAVIANKRIVSREDWIAYVSHDAADGGWQFHTAEPGPPSEADAAVVSLKEVLQIDPSIEQLAELPVGWHAWRESKHSNWNRALRETN